MKNFKKVLGVALALAMVVGAFAMFSIGTSAEATYTNMGDNVFASTPAYDFISEKGITFDDFAGSTTNKDSGIAYTRDKAGMLISAQTSNDSRMLYIVKQGEGDYALDLSAADGLCYVNGNIGKAKNADKYEKNSMLLDLLNNPESPDKFSISMEMTITGESGKVSGAAPTSDNENSLITYYRGISVFSINSFDWVFKVTAANIPAITGSETLEDGTTLVEIADSIPDNMKDKGYIYGPDGTIFLRSTGDDAIANGYASIISGKNWADNGRSGSCISEEMMDGDGVGDALTYTLGVPFQVRMDFTRNSSSTGLEIKTYVDDTHISTRNVKVNGSGNASDWTYGVRIIDQDCNMQLDNIKLTTETPVDLHTGAWKNVTRRIVEEDGVGVSVIEVCNVCGEEISKEYPSVYYQGVKSVNVRRSSSGTNDSRPATATTEEFIGRTYHENFSPIWDDLKTAPFWINFDIKNVTNVKGSAKNSNCGLVTWRPSKDIYSGLIRLLDGGKVIMGDTAGKGGYNYVEDSTFRISGTDSAPGNYSFHIFVTPATGNYDLYIDDLNDSAPMFYHGSARVYTLISTTSKKVDKNGDQWPKLRFNDVNVADYRIENFTVTRGASADEHAHSNSLSTVKDKSVVVGYDSLSTGYNCYCGEAVSAGDYVVEQLVKCDSVYYGNGEIAGLPKEGEYWIATDVNIRNAAALEAMKAADGAEIIALGDVAIDLIENAVVPNTYQYAVKVVADGKTADLEVYCDGKAVYEAEDVAVFDKVTLGNTDSTDVRFNLTKVAKIDAEGTKVAITYNDTADNTLKPCKHQDDGGSYSTDAEGGLIYVYTCSKCGEKVVLKTEDKYSESMWTGELKPVDGKITYVGNKFTNFQIPAEFRGADGKPYQLKFKLTLNSGGTGSSLDNGGSGRNICNFDNNFHSVVRAYAVPNPAGGFYGDRISVESKTANRIKIAEIGIGESVEITLAVTPAKATVDIYANGVYVGTRDSATGAMDAADTQIRFGDGACFGYVASDFALLGVEEEPHTHTDNWATAEERTVSMSADELKYSFVCYCGETVTYNKTVDVIEATNVYYGTKTLELPTEGNFWVAFDYNARSAEALAAASKVFALGEIVSASTAELSAPATYQYAINVAYTSETAADVYVYYGEDMTPVKLSGVSAADLASIVLGDTETTDIRFYNVRIVTLGDTEGEKLVYADNTDMSLRPCYHQGEAKFISVPGTTYTGKIKAINKLAKSYTCELCGEVVVEEFGDTIGVYDNWKDTNALVLDSTGSMAGVARGVRYIAVDRKDIDSDSDAYWLSYDLKATFSEGQVNNVKNKGTNGASILAIRVPYVDDGTNNEGTWGFWASKGKDTYAYLQLMRAYDIKRTDAIGINFYHGGASNPVFTMESGETYRIAIWIDQKEDEVHYKAYVDGVLMYERHETGASWLKVMDANRVDGDILDEKNAIGERMFMFRFLDGNYGDFSYSNISLVKDAEGAPHVHEALWLNDEEKAASSFVINDDGTINYTYQCYCGETVVAGVGNVLTNPIVPKYNATEAAEVVADGIIAPNTAFVGSVMAKKLPAEGIALVTIGGNAIVSVDAEGAVYLGENKTDFVMGAEYCDFAIYRNYKDANVYFGGEFLGAIEIDAATLEAVVGSEGMGIFHFDKMAVVEFSTDDDKSFEEGTDGHEHIFDPYTAELIFNEERTTINVEYICTVCDRPAVDGIVDDLYDDDETDKIAAVIDSNEAVILDTKTLLECIGEKDDFWFSADFAVKAMSQKNRQNVLSFAGQKLVLVDADGTLRLGDEANTVIGSVVKNQIFNITFNAVAGGENALLNIYIDGNYCCKYSLEAPETLDVAVGGETAPVMDVTNIKLAELGNGGQRAIGAFHCVIHIYDPANTVINYLDLGTFAATNKCLVCGHKVEERAVENFYDGAIAPILNYGGIETKMADSGEVIGGSYWIVADVNKRGDIGSFNGYVNLIGEYGASLVLVDAQGNLMLGNGKTLGNYFGVTNPKITYNFAINYAYVDDSFAYNVYIDGKYVGSFTEEDIKYDYEWIADSYEEFGAAELNNVKFYNIRRFTAGEGTPITFTYAENPAEIPCGHIFDANTMEKKAVFGDDIQLVYICKNCGERVHTIFDVDLFDEGKNTAIVFDENGEYNLTSTVTLNSSADVLGSKAAPYWIKFKLHVNSFNVDEIVYGGGTAYTDAGGRNLMNFDGNNNSPLRLFAVKDYKTGGYLDNVLIVRSNSSSGAAELVRMYEGESYEFALYTDPSTGFTEIYVNGEYAAIRKNAFNATSKSLRFLDGSWGDFIMSEFEFVTGTNLAHVHTAEYSEALGMVPTFAYGDQTLKHTYMCTCGQVITEGVDKALADEVVDIENITSATAIPEAAKATVSGSYWVSAKVYGDGSDATVYGYNGTALVGIANGVYTIGGEATAYAVSGAATAGDYDVVSINVIPGADKAIVYINGAQAGLLKGVDFADTELFNVTLGGGAALSFKFIKVVTLADGVNNKVNIYGCGDHAFGYRSGVTATVTDNGVEYKCKFCDKLIRTVEIGDAKVFTTTNGTGTINISGNAHFIGIGEGIHENLIAPADGGSFIVSFDIKPTDLSGLGTGGKSLLTWMPGTTAYRQWFRAFKIDNNSTEIMPINKSSVYTPFTKPVTFTVGTTYNVVIEADPSTNTTYFYIDGNFVGTTDFVIGGSASTDYRLRFGDAATGKWDVTNIKMYNPATDKIEEVQTGAATPVAHSHFPDTSKAHSITVNDGVITQSFTCACGEVLELDTMIDLIPDEVKNHTALYSFKQVFAKDVLKTGSEGTYVISFDLEVNAVNVANLIDGGTNGRSIASIGAGQLRLLRGFPVAYTAGRGYTDANGDGWADNVIELKYYDKNRNSLAIMTTGDKVNFTYVIDPNGHQMLIYVDGVLKQTASGFGNITADYIRFLEGLNYGNYNFTNLVVARMTAEDTCQHEIPACDGTNYSFTCDDCGKTFERTHNYVAQGDVTGKWTKYTCADCGKTYLVFNDKAVIADLTYSSKTEFMKLLTEMYYPVFR